MIGYPCDNYMKKEFNLSKCIRKEVDVKGYDGIKECPADFEYIKVINVKEFIKRLLTPNNISKGFVEVSTIKYYAGEKLI